MYQFMVFKKNRLTKRALDAGDCSTIGDWRQQHAYSFTVARDDNRPLRRTLINVGAELRLDFC